MRTQPRTRSRPVAKVVKSLLGVLALVAVPALVVGGGQVASADAGRVEIDNAIGTPGSNNNPHQLCGIRVEFYNFTSATHTVTVAFTGQGSSGSGVVAGVLEGSDLRSFTFSGGGVNNQTPDVTKKYFIDTTGLTVTNDNQGYHVDVDTNVDGSLAKQKVIFVQSCNQPNPTTVTPLAPTINNSVCVGTTPSTPTYVIPTVTGVIYSIDGHQVTGRHDAAAGSTVKVDAAPADGYVFGAEAPKSFTLRFDAAPNCALPAVTPVAPTIAQSVCVGTTPSTPTYFIPTVTGVVYSQSAGSHNATPDSVVTITAAADETHRIATEAQTTFTLTFNGLPNCSNTIVIPTAPDLSIVKAGPTAAVLPGAQVLYTLTVRNNGTAPATNVKVTDDLAAGLTLVSASGTDWVCASGSKVSCDLTGALAVGASKVINVVTTLSATYDAATVVNTAVVTPTDATPADNSSTVTTPVVGNLAISKTGTASLFPGNELVWTLTVTNKRGTPATGFTVTDTLPAETRYSLASGTDFSCTNVGQDISCLYTGSLAVGSSAQIVVRALLSAGYTGATVSNTAVLVPGRPDSDSTDNTSTSVSTVTFTGGGGGEVVVPTPSPSVSPAASPTLAPSAGGGGGGALPFTGLPTSQLLLGGVLLLLVGLLVALSARRHAER